jgi:tyrosyl-tRNA synthetase
MTLSEDLIWRGQIKDKTFASTDWLNTPRTFYLGVDCSSDSLTIGNLAVFMLARRMLLAGWKTVLLVGGATSLVGDPGGKDEERQLKSHEEISHNVAGIKTQVTSLFDNKEFTLVDNYDWLKDVGYLEFLRDVGKNYSMTELIQRDFIAERMGEGSTGISYAEFSYTLMQGYDYWHLYKNMGVVLQIGGSDQWGNMLSGVPLIRKKENQEVHAMSMPLIIDKTTGKKFGKSEDGAVWLDAAKTSPTQFYQFWINADDAGTEDYLKVYTELDKDSVTELMERHNADRKLRLAQLRLAKEVTTIVHGAEATAFAEAVTKYLIGEKPVGEAGESELSEIRSQLASIQIDSIGASILDSLSETLVSSKTEARRLLEAGAITINGEKVTRENFEASDFQHGRLLLRKGKKFKDSALIELT